MNFSKYFICTSTPCGERQATRYTDEEARHEFLALKEKSKKAKDKTVVQLFGYDEKHDKNVLLEQYQNYGPQK